MAISSLENLLDSDLYMVLQSIGMGDLDMAKEFTRSFCEANFDILPEDLTQWVIQRLDESSSPYHLPPEIETLVVMEDVTQTFNPNRYYVSEREYKLLDEIIGLRESSELLANAKIPFANTTLLFGPPGVGKTQFGRCLAYMLNLPFVYVDLCRVVGAQLGETGKNLQNIFNFVSKTPCLFMLDEIDAMGANRGTISNGGSGDEMTRTTIALMQCMDRLPQNVVLIAATNRQDMLDAALRRRFSIKHEFKHFLPDELVNMVINYLEDVIETGNLSLEWSVEDIRSQCSISTSQSDLISLTNRAIVRAVRTDHIIKLKEEDRRQRISR